MNRKGKPSLHPLEVVLRLGVAHDVAVLVPRPDPLVAVADLAAARPQPREGEQGPGLAREAAVDYGAHEHVLEPRLALLLPPSHRTAATCLACGQRRMAVPSHCSGLLP